MQRVYNLRFTYYLSPTHLLTTLHSDFRTHVFFLSVHHLWVVADDRYFSSPISGPKILSFTPPLWVVADDRYFLSPIFGPKIVLSVHHLWVVSLLV